MGYAPNIFYAIDRIYFTANCFNRDLRFDK